MDILAADHSGRPAPIGAALPEHSPWCFGCAPGSDAGLGLRLHAAGSDTLIGRFQITDRHQGAPGLAHGGVLAALMDELLGSVNGLLGTPAVTARLEIDFVRPVPVGAVLHLSAQLVAVDGRKVTTEGEGRLDSPTGPVAVHADALFIRVPAEHFQRHAAPGEVG